MSIFIRLFFHVGEESRLQEQGWRARVVGAGGPGVAQRVKPLLHKWEDLSLDPQNPHKSDSVIPAKERGEMEADPQRL